MDGARDCFMSPPAFDVGDEADVGVPDNCNEDEASPAVVVIDVEEEEEPPLDLLVAQGVSREDAERALQRAKGDLNEVRGGASRHQLDPPRVLKALGVFNCLKVEILLFEPWFQTSTCAPYDEAFLLLIRQRDIREEEEQMRAAMSVSLEEAEEEKDRRAAEEREKKESNPAEYFGERSALLVRVPTACARVA